MKKILQLTTHPRNVYHFGGAIRTAKIKQALEKKYEVKTLNIEVTQDTEQSCNNFLLKLVLPPSSESPDIQISKLLGNIQDKKLLRDLKNNFKNIMFDAVLLEQPYLYEFFIFLKQVKFINANVKLIYSSHNIEKNMTFKSDIEYIDKIEQSAIKNSDVQICCSLEEKEYIGNSCGLYLNGCEEIHSLGSNYWKDLMDTTKNNFVFIGGNHLPNIEGLNKLKPYLNDSINIFVVGECGKYVSSKSFKKLGILTDQEICDLIYESDGIILPIQSGSGINLKTVQALYSNKAIIATKFSFRQLDKYIKMDGVFTVDTISELPYLLNKKYKKSYNRNCEELLWNNIFNNLAEFINL